MYAPDFNIFVSDNVKFSLYHQSVFDDELGHTIVPCMPVLECRLFKSISIQTTLAVSPRYPATLAMSQC